jgi:hypothetical protein
MMRLRSISVLGALLLFALAVAAWATPVPAPFAPLLSLPGETHSISGKITSVSDTQIALDVLKNQKPDTIHFVIDEHTTVEGKLAVGVPAAVDYRMEGDKMIATRVIVTQASGMTAN